MSRGQAKILDFLEQNVARLHLGGYGDLARRAGEVVDALHRGETVWAVVLADAYGFGAEFVGKMRLAFGVGEI